MNYVFQEKSSVAMRNVDISNKNYLFWLGGFFEGEGSASVSIVVNSSFKHGVQLQPVFNVSQHINGLPILQSFKDLFGAGYLVQKSGSDQVWVYTLPPPSPPILWTGRGVGYKNMLDKAVPFIDTYVSPFSCKQHEYNIFKTVCESCRAGTHTSQQGFIELVKLVYTYQGKGKTRKRTLDEIIFIIENKETYFKDKPSD